MKKNSFNILVNILSLLTFASMISTGFILKYSFHGGGPRQHGMTLFCGLSRHQWEEVHFWMAIVFLCVLILHFVLHWPWIWNTAWGSKHQPRSIRVRCLAVFVAVIAAVLAVLPWTGLRQTRTDAGLQHRMQEHH